MSRLIGKALPGSLLNYLQSDPRQHEEKAILLITVDSRGWPHAALLSSWEVFATDDRNIKVATYIGTTTTTNLKRGGKATIVAFNAGSTFYVKGSTTLVRERLKADEGNTLFNLRVDAILEDSMPGVDITGINYKGRMDIEQHFLLHQEIAQERP